MTDRRGYLALTDDERRQHFVRRVDDIAVAIDRFLLRRKPRTAEIEGVCALFDLGFDHLSRLPPEARAGMVEFILHGLEHETATTRLAVQYDA